MEIELLLDKEITEDLSNELETLAQEQVNAGVKVERIYGSSKLGEKSAFDIESLTFLVTSISTFVSILALWLQTRPKFTIETEVGGNKVILKNPTEEHLVALLDKQPELARSTKVKLIIRKKLSSEDTA